MKKSIIIFVILLLGIMFTAQSSVAGPHRLGVGWQWWQTIDDIDFDNFDEKGYAWMFTYQYKPSLLGCQLDLEFSNQKLGSRSRNVISPVAYVLLGGLIYGGLGIGSNYASDNWTDPFYALRLGLDFTLFEKFHLDVNANYRFEDWDYDKVVEDIDTDTITLGLAVRYEF
ncbi:MAG: hypothetical protein HF978_02640 [Desulfobacteraceae bacterium]|nr:hypothetical protein [Desulfobacteraceae bacterium]MBC2754423.1 hypothetical protein [Desulfobacteraceae bacterium]